MEVIGSIYTGVTADFRRGVYPIARRVKAEQHDLGVVMADVNVLGSFEAKFKSTNRILEYRIRKLTPRECGRLMGVSDEDISKMAAVNSNTQLYKQFGNSIVVDVMCAMFRNLNIDQEVK